MNVGNNGNLIGILGCLVYELIWTKSTVSSVDLGARMMHHHVFSELQHGTSPQKGPS